MDDRGSTRDRELHHLPRAAPSARGLAVPHGDEDVAVRDGCAARHHIGIDVRIFFAGQFEPQVARSSRASKLSRLRIGEAASIFGTGEREMACDSHPNSNATSAAIWSAPSAMGETSVNAADQERSRPAPECAKAAPASARSRRMSRMRDRSAGKLPGGSASVRCPVTPTLSTNGRRGGPEACCPRSIFT